MRLTPALSAADEDTVLAVLSVPVVLVVACAATAWELLSATLLVVVDCPATA